MTSRNVKWCPLFDELPKDAGSSETVQREDASFLPHQNRVCVLHTGTSVLKFQWDLGDRKLSVVHGQHMQDALFL